MKAQKLNKKHIRPQTFWDVEFDKLDTETDKNFIISRLTQRGSDLELLHLHSVFTYEQIYKVLSNFKGVDKKTLEFYKQMTYASS